MSFEGDKANGTGMENNNQGNYKEKIN